MENEHDKTIPHKATEDELKTAIGTAVLKAVENLKMYWDNDEINISASVVKEISIQQCKEE